MDLLALFLGLAIGLIIGGLLAIVLRRGSGAATTDPAVMEARHEMALAELRSAEQSRFAEMQAQEYAARAEANAELASAVATSDGLREQLASLEQRLRDTEERHRLERTAQTERERAESKVLAALAPVQENLRSMHVKVTELETQRNRQHGELSQQLKAANESEERLRATAESLASALKSNSTRGVWGETQLRNVVQAAGLLERVDFDVQSSINSDAGTGRPDMVVHLPGGKSIAVDAKVPFTAYLEASQIPATAIGEEGQRREQLMKQHVKALRAHVDALASKTYWAGLEASPELVIAFIPSESLVSSALEADPAIMDYAFGKRVALSSPVTLWSVLKTVAFSWQQDVLTEDAKVLFDLSRELYSRLAKLSEHIEKLGRSIESSVKNYNAFVGSMERQVLPSARKLNALDETKVLGTLGGIEESKRELTAFELTEALSAVTPDDEDAA